MLTSYAVEEEWRKPRMIILGNQSPAASAVKHTLARPLPGASNQAILLASFERINRNSTGSLAANSLSSCSSPVDCWEVTLVLIGLIGGAINRQLL